MKLTELPVDRLKEAPWNPNAMDEKMAGRLRESLTRYGAVSPLVVRPVDADLFEVLSGNQRLKATGEIGLSAVPCVVVNLDDAEAMLLAQALNEIHGEDELVKKGELLKTVLSEIPEDRVISLLPETAESLNALSTLNKEDLAKHLQAWEQAQAARLKHMQLQFTNKQLEVVKEAVDSILPDAKDEDFDNPNDRSNAMYLLCQYYLERREKE
jgi:ParB family chromosome partitioning protein